MSFESRKLPAAMLGGFETVRLTREELAQVMVTDCIAARDSNRRQLPKLVFSSNGQGIALAGRSRAFRQAMDEADIIHADGMPVVLMSRLTREPLPERIATTDYFHDAARAAIAAGLTFYMLGATEEQNRKAIEAIRKQYPDLKIVGSHHGYFSEEESSAICAQINELKPDVLWVALGKPRQELWCVQHRDKLNNVGWIKTCGGLYAFLCGDVKRAPTWMQDFGLEWLYRMLEDPRRLMRRYLMTNPYAFYRLVKHTRFRSGCGSS